MKTAISLPDMVYMEAEKLSKRLHMSRSELYATAIKLFVMKEKKMGITEQLDRVYGENAIGYDNAIELAAIEDLDKNGWQ